MVVYDSRKMEQHKVNYAPHDLELAAIVHALQMWRHYLLGNSFELKMNHLGLRYIFTQSNINARKRRWLEFLCEYDFIIKYIKGKENCVTNAPSRRRHIATMTSMRSNLR